MAENAWACSRIFRRLRHPWLAETFASTARGLSWFLWVLTTTGYVSREQSFFTTTETTKTTKRKKITAGYLTLLRLLRAWTMPNYTQGAAALYPGLCASALTARADQCVFGELIYVKRHKNDAFQMLCQWYVNGISTVCQRLSIELFSAFRCCNFASRKAKTGCTRQK